MVIITNKEIEVELMRYKSKISAVISIMLLMGILSMNFSTNAETKKPKPIGVDSVSGVVKSVDTVDKNVFVIITTDSKNEERVFYTGNDREVSKAVLRLKSGDKIVVKYVLGTPVKYKETMAMPLSKISKRGNKTPIIGINKISGTVKSALWNTDENVYLTITSKGKLSSYYTSATSAKANPLMRLKSGNKVKITYALGTPIEYMKTIAMPLIDFKIVK